MGNPNNWRTSRFITTTIAAQMLKVSVGTVYNLMRDGSLQYFRRGRKGWNMVSLESVQGLIDDWLKQSAPEP